MPDRQDLANLDVSSTQALEVSHSILGQLHLLLFQAAPHYSCGQAGQPWYGYSGKCGPSCG